jgi:asparagine synthase (glutamine-hydrolysing)
MTSVLQHRGPDDSGTFSGKNIELGHRRLSIIDLSKAGKQPMTNEDGSVVIVFNGEIYNFKDVKKQLQKHTFKSHSDTEVLVHGYEEWGLEGLLSRLNGMFAFAIWDSNKKRLFLARDRLGIKPLYYTFADGHFLFSSEIKSLLIYEGVKRELNPEALDDYLSFRYVPGPKTLFKDIFCLEAGKYIEMSGKDFSDFNVKSYWAFSFAKKQIKSEDYYVKRLYALLSDSVRNRLLSDVPLGAYLSGGIDSASIVALMSKEVSEPVKTFTVGFGEDIKADEISRARKTSELLETDHHELIIEPKHLKSLPKIIWHLDQPIGDSIMQYRNIVLGRRLNRMTPRFVREKVLLPFVRKAPLPLLDMFFDYPESLGEEGRKRVAEFVRNWEKPSESYISNIALFSDGDKKDLFTDAMMSKLAQVPGISEKIGKHFRESGRKDMISRILFRELNTWLPENILFRNDKMTMAHSIEGRVPFLDHRLVEFSASVPPNLKIKKLTEKHILRSAMKKTLPKFLTSRKKKAFYIPVKEEFDKEIFDITKNILSESNIRKNRFFRYDYVKRLVLDSKRSRFVCGKQLMSLTNFELWYKIFIENENVNRII